ncbi:12522_t:CDS:2, partial [Racocetra fulgida]
PYSTNDREEFKKCDHECIDEKHHNKVEGKNPVKSYCTQKIFHSSLDHNYNTTPDGAVMEAVFTFIETRKKSRKSTQVGQMAIDRDTVSLILFNENTTVAFENRTLTNSEELLREMMKYTAGGGTNFAKGIKEATKLIKTHRDPSK